MTKQTQNLSQSLMIFDRSLAAPPGRRACRIKEPMEDISRQRHANGLRFQPGALLECEPKGEWRGAFFRHAAALLRCLAPPPDSRKAIARGADILPFIGVLGYSTKA
ncbi:MAG: hypothetical protein JHD35_26190 [Sphingopyxis sp.]|nr:hypothetical protein [Sphingopyxis sp.]